MYSATLLTGSAILIGAVMAILTVLKRFALLGLVIVLSCFMITLAAKYDKNVQHTINKYNTVKASFEQYKETNIKKKRNRLLEWCVAHSKSSVPKSDLNKIVDVALDSNKPLLILSIIAVESHFSKEAVSKAGARGLMQVMWKTWSKELKPIGITTALDLHEIKLGIKAGEYIIDKYYNKTGNLKKALRKYVGGTNSYAVKVLTNYAELNLLVRSK